MSPRGGRIRSASVAFTHQHALDTSAEMEFFHGAYLRSREPDPAEIAALQAHVDQRYGTRIQALRRSVRICAGPPRNFGLTPNSWDRRARNNCSDWRV